jgi:hypothetical protein
MQIQKIRRVKELDFVALMRVNMALMNHAGNDFITNLGLFQF